MKQNRVVTVPFYILEGRKPIRCNDADKLAKFALSGQRIIGYTKVGDAEVSTIFLTKGVGDRPALFETMVFGGRYDQRRWRYATYDEAEAGHARIVEMANASLSETAAARPAE